ncbi:hypothetical protein O181_107835 [Austropuccinia psidii MF-1]|uniref:Retrotransposon gag domain-containing protein n=1 Tax=Austropuccinia psidii MF-1 TaxID=1389203 RepID=A0A9Q3JVA5_9BASI|nr:hypothetical protein [Austropuccinia psidii MF-1]
MQFSELEASHERMKKLTASMDKIVKNLQEGHAQLSKASEETNKRLNLVFEEQHHSKRDRDCLDQDINKLFNFYHNMKPQPQGHVMDNPYQPDDIKPDVMLMNKERSPSKYQDGDGIYYSEKEALKKLPEASSWPKFSGTGEYDHMELIDYIDGLFIDVPSIPDYWITARLNTELNGHASIWYTEMKEIHGRRNLPWWKSQIIQKYSNGTWIWQKTMTFKNDKYSVDKDAYEWCLRQSKRLKAIDPQMNIQMRNHKLLTQLPGELEHEVKCRWNQNCTLDDIANTLQDHYANNCPKEQKKVYAIEKVPEEESPTEDSESNSMGYAIREQSDDNQDPREELPGGIPRGNPTRNPRHTVGSRHATGDCHKNLCKHTQDAQTFLVTPTEGMAYIHGTATKVTSCIDNAQNPLIIDSGAHCFIVAQEYLDIHFPN